jgi:transcription initiation factor TFIIB
MIERMPEQSMYPSRLTAGNSAGHGVNGSASGSLATHDKGLYTNIGRMNRDATGRQLSSGTAFGMERMRVWDTRSKFRRSADRNMKQACDLLNTFADRLSLSEMVIERAALIYRRALDKSLIRGRSISSIAAASLYAACRDREVPRTLKDIAVASNLSRKEIAKSYRLLLTEMEMRMPVLDPAKCVTKIASKAKLSERVRRRALQILHGAVQARLSAGIDPMGLSASALYMACALEGQDVTQRNVAEAAGVTEVTVRNRYKSLKLILGI